MLVDGNVQNLHVVSVVSQEFHAFGELQAKTRSYFEFLCTY